MSWLGKFDDFDDFSGPPPTKRRNLNNTIVSTSNFPPANISDENTSIDQLMPGAPNVTIIGLVLSKEEAREINRKNSANNSSGRFVLNFVIRDSASSYISATCWGSENHIKELTENFHISDVVEIFNPQIQTKPSDGSDRFKPWTPSPYQLNLSEHHSTLKVYQGWDLSNFSSLQHVPIRPPSDYYVLSDVIANGQRISGENINILAALKNVSPVKEMTTKKGKQTKRCEVKLFDETCPSFALVLWDDEIINQAVLWNPGEYVIFAADVRVSFDNFRNSMVATANSKTIFIVNPDTKEAHALYRYAQTQHIDDETVEAGDGYTQRDPDLGEVKDVLSVQKIKTTEQEMVTNLSPPYFCIVFAYITQFDIDQQKMIPVRYNCPKCKQTLDDSQQVCLNPGCVDKSTSGQYCADMQYDIPVTLSDHTGSLLNCRLNNSVTEEMITFQAADFLLVNESQKTQCKWKFLLERCKVYLKLQRSKAGDRVFYRVLSCALADTQEVQRHLEHC